MRMRLGIWSTWVCIAAFLLGSGMGCSAEDLAGEGALLTETEDSGPTEAVFRGVGVSPVVSESEPGEEQEPWVNEEVDDPSGDGGYVAICRFGNVPRAGAHVRRTLHVRGAGRPGQVRVYLRWKYGLLQSESTGGSRCGGVRVQRIRLLHAVRMARMDCVDGVWASMACGEGSVCCQGICAAQVCEPYTEKVCVDNTTVAVCNDCGTEMVEQPCPGSYYCDPNTALCQCEVGVKILFMLDASGSMELNMVGDKTRWEVAQETIESVMGEYPHFRYGLMTFPNEPVLCEEPGCSGGGGCGEMYTNGVNAPIDTPASTISDYLKARKLVGEGGELELVLTPLLGAFDFLVSGYNGPMKANDGTPTYVILISDGQDTCYSPAEPKQTVGPLGQAAESLSENWGIQTYPIGFGLEEGSEQLNALAQRGGTGLAEHLEADDLSSLTSVLVEVLSSVNPKTCAGGVMEPAQAPDCIGSGTYDADQDGWCSDLDCDDDNPAVNPGATEWENGKDDDCDEEVDEDPNAIPNPAGTGIGCNGVDFLFVVDNSGSMGGEQTNLINSFPGFISTIQNTLSTQDYNIMVVDSDALGSGGTGNGVAVTSCFEQGGFLDCKCAPVATCCNTVCIEEGPTAICNGHPACNQPPPVLLSPCDYTLGAGKISSPQNEVCFEGDGERFMTSDEPDLEGSFACVANVGTSGSGSEKVMESMMAAVTPPLMMPGSCNGGFIREDAILVVTFITDEEDEHSDGTPQEWKEALVQAKGGKEDGIFVLGVFGDPESPDTPCGQGGQFGGGSADDAPKLQEFLASFGDRGHFCSVCSYDYSECFYEAVTGIDTTCDEYVTE